MKIKGFSSLTLLFLILLSPRLHSNESPWVIDEGENAYVYKNVLWGESVKLRSGYFRESTNPEVAFKGCILYLEGLGDSILNHEALYKVLSHAGYRVIFFDYMGQGGFKGYDQAGRPKPEDSKGSEGSMNHTRIIDPLFPRLQISTMAEEIWEKYAAIKK